MKKIPPQRSRRWLTGAAAGLAAFAPGERLAATPWVQLTDPSLRQAAALDRYSGGYEGVLGTSLDLVIEAPRPTDALECERQLLDEIERLRRICSTYDSTSEISRVSRGEPVVSAELAALFAAYATWTTRTHGLVSCTLGDVIAEWREAARRGRVPDRAALAQASQRPRAFNVDALGKGFIIDRAVAVARRFAPGGLINLGGDIRAWGETAWPIRVTDPRRPADNASPLIRFTLREAAVATSGGYARFYEVSGKRFSHLIDPRTQWPLAAGGSATVVAGDSVTANALSTAASIGGSGQGAALAEEHGAANYLFADAGGKISAGGLFVPLAAAANGGQPATPGDNANANPSPAPAGAAEKPPASAVAPVAAWPAGFEVTVPVILKKHAAPREVFRPYLVVWVQNAQGRVVRTVSQWGTDERYQRKLTKWLYELDHSKNDYYTAARATRPPGTYTVTWDGKDDYGRRLPAGAYKICLEICREAGHHTYSELDLACEQEPATAALAETAESDAGTITYGPPKSEL